MYGCFVPSLFEIGSTILWKVNGPDGQTKGKRDEKEDIKIKSQGKMKSQSFFWALDNYV